MSDVAGLRAEFPVCERIAYLNAGTCGPLPGAALRAGADSALVAAEQGRSKAYFEHLVGLRDRLRTRYATAIGARAEDVAITTATSDGMVRVIAGLGLRAGDEILTAPDEHPGLLGPLAAAKRQLGVQIRTAPLQRIHEAVTPQTRLVACSHVSWMTGELAPPELAEVGRDVPVLLDGAQGAGAVAVDPEALGCAAYAAAGQKWLCGPVGMGLLWVAPRWRERIAVTGPTYANLANPGAGLDAMPWDDARAYDAVAISGQQYAAAEAAAGVLESAGWTQVREHAASLADRFAHALRDAGYEVAPRHRTTLVSWTQEDAVAAVERCAAADVTIRSLPGETMARASVGAWSDESDLERLLAAIAG